MSMKSPTHPGLLVRQIIDDLGMTVVDAAQSLGVSRQQLTRLTGCNSAVSPEMALRLETVFGSTAEAWLRMQNAWNLARLRLHSETITAGLKRAEPACE